MKEISRLTRLLGRSAILPILLLALATAAIAPSEPLLRPSGFNLFSKQQDIQLGQQNAAQVKKQMPVLPDSSPVVQYVQQVGRKLVSTMPQPTYPYNFHVIQE